MPNPTATPVHTVSDYLCSLLKLRAGPSWWLAPMKEWPQHRHLSDAEYHALFPPCWQAPQHELLWILCDQCWAKFDPQVGLPSRWICRCGLNDMGWRHQEPPPVDEMCRACYDLMTAEGIDHAEWGKRVRDQDGIDLKELIMMVRHAG